MRRLAFFIIGEGEVVRRRVGMRSLGAIWSLQGLQRTWHKIETYGNLRFKLSSIGSVYSNGCWRGVQALGRVGIRDCEGTGRCVVISIRVFRLFLFVPTWRTRARAVPELVLHFPLVCTILEAKFVKHYWWRLQGMRFSLDLVLLHNSCVYLLYFWQNIFKIFYFTSSKLFLWVCWKRSLYVSYAHRGKIVTTK